MNNIFRIFFFLCLCFCFTACSSEGDSNDVESKKDHVWKEQTDTIDKAKEVEGVIMESVDSTRNMIEEQGQ